MTKPEKIYKDRIADISRTIFQLRRKDLLLAALKIPLFLLLLYSLYRLISGINPATLAIFLALFIMFTLLAMAHEKIIKKTIKSNLCKMINKSEVSALKDFYPSGQWWGISGRRSSLHL